MWKRVLHIWPLELVLAIINVNRLIPGWSEHEIGTNTQLDRDVHNLLDGTKPHIAFTRKEAKRGKDELLKMGITGPYVCLMVRDNAYLETIGSNDWSYHDYRDCNIENYVLAAEELASRGYFVLRMGAKVHKKLESHHPKVIDYANKFRSDFMDIYLPANCSFCISNGTGLDAISYIFRRPTVFISYLDIGHMVTFNKNYITLCKHLVKDGREMSLREIIEDDALCLMFSKDYKEHGITLLENTPEETRDAVVELAERLEGTWVETSEDKYLQERFWKIFPTDIKDQFAGKPLHGEIRGQYSASYLRNNPWFVQ